MTDATQITIRPIEPRDREPWARLLSAHGGTYDLALTAATLRTVWAWLMDASAPLGGFVAIDGYGQVVGIVHYQRMFRALAGSMSCYLSDLYVDPVHRGTGVGRRLVESVLDFADESGCSNVRWLSRESNLAARRLYDCFAARTEFVLYEVALEGDCGAASYWPDRLPPVGPVISRIPRPKVK